MLDKLNEIESSKDNKIFSLLWNSYYVYGDMTENCNKNFNS